MGHGEETTESIRSGHPRRGIRDGHGSERVAAACWEVAQRNAVSAARWVPLPTRSGDAFLNPANQLVVLCIDDNASGLNIRRLLLESMGFRVLIAQDGRPGLDIVRWENVDAVILDYQMPGMDGEEVATRLRAQHPRIPILLLTGSPGLLPESLLSIVDSFVEKGHPAALLIEEVERLTRVGRSPEAEERMRA